MRTTHHCSPLLALAHYDYPLGSPLITRVVSWLCSSLALGEDGIDGLDTGRRSCHLWCLLGSGEEM